ncbi:MAG: SDR family NAD(P)-dependent oxidoreductase [Pseudomonadota bacterium]
MASESKWALVTGASGGIGQAIVDEFIAASYEVVAVDKLPSRIAEHTSVRRFEFDLERFVLDEPYADAFIKDVEHLTGGVGISALINNAAVQILGHCSEVSRAEWHESFNVNLGAPFFLVQGFLSQLERNRGSVVNISSIHATQTKQRFVTYATTKGALSSLTRNLAVDLRDKIRINAIEPAAVGTEMLKAGFSGKEHKLAELEKYHPIARLAEPREVAELALYLCSDKSRFVHGACISASGGIQGSLSDPD